MIESIKDWEHFEPLHLGISTQNHRETRPEALLIFREPRHRSLSKVTSKFDRDYKKRYYIPSRMLRRDGVFLAFVSAMRPAGSPPVGQAAHCRLLPERVPLTALYKALEIRT